MRTFVLDALTLILLPIVAVSGWFAYLNTRESAEHFARNLADALGQRVHDRVADFFEVPKSIISFNVEQARAGLLDERQRERMMRGFLLQIRQQPAATRWRHRPAPAAGTYCRGADAAHLPRRRCHPPHYPGRNARYRFRCPYPALVRQGSQFRPDGLVSAYRYHINDAQGAYDGIGIGMSAPLYDPAGRFIGVATADIALSQLSAMLREWSEESGGIAFLADGDGKLLASSTPHPLYREDIDGFERLAPEASDDPLIQAAGKIGTASGQPEGSAFLQAEGQRYLFNWRTHQLEQGPPLRIGIILPQSHFDALAASTLENELYLGLMVAVFSLFISLLATD